MAQLRSTAVLADIGGTNARFARLRDGRIGMRRQVRVADYPSLNAALRDYLAAWEDGPGPKRLALAAAGPIAHGQVRLTNSPWRISARALRSAFRVEDVMLINDFSALALAVPYLRRAHTVAIGGGRGLSGAPIAILGPGTGLGVAGLVPGPGIPSAGPRVLETEGGHVTMAPSDARESAILEVLRGRFGHVSAERVLCGDGLVNLYEAIAVLDDISVETVSAPEITARALAGSCRCSTAALATFCAMLGTVAGNLALTLGARGGVYLAGGVVPHFTAYLAASAFRERFEAKGRFRAYMAAIPVRVIVHPDPAFLGLRALLEEGS
jgi:glucokinase